MFYFLFIFYFILFCWLITRIKFFAQSGISKKLLLLLFSLRVAMSLVTCYFNLYFFPVSDSLAFHNGGLIEYELLFTNPHEYLVNIFRDSHQNDYGGFLDVTKSYWNDTKGNFMYKMLSVFDIFSRKNFVINTLFFNFLVFFGPVALFKVFIKIFPASFYAIIVCIFLLPSALFFSSMIHRDGLILLSISMVIYHFYFLKFEWKRIVAIALFMSAILILRNYVIIALVPAITAWLISRNKPKYRFLVFAGVYLISAILFFGSGYISQKLNLPKYVSERQLAFIKISKLGSSTIPMLPLKPNLKSFVTNAPQAIDHSLMRPYITEAKSFVYIPFIIENMLVGILLLLFIFFRKKIRPVDGIVYLCFFFTASIFLITGYTVPIIGAIVRYRSIYLILLLLPIICYIDWNRFINKFYINNKKI